MYDVYADGGASWESMKEKYEMKKQHPYYEKSHYRL